VPPPKAAIKTLSESNGIRNHHILDSSTFQWGIRGIKLLIPINI
jgi:hypothetical protein